VPVLAKETRQGLDTRCPAPPEFSADDRAVLLEVARTALAVATGVQPADELTGLVRRSCRLSVGRQHGATFVTLFEGAELRGCVGTLDTSSQLPQAVARAAMLAARADPRFWPVQASELAGIRI
jgi:AMMECR1 domain-containing protein